MHYCIMLFTNYYMIVRINRLLYGSINRLQQYIPFNHALWLEPKLHSEARPIVRYHVAAAPSSVVLRNKKAPRDANYLLTILHGILMARNFYFRVCKYYDPALCCLCLLRARRPPEGSGRCSWTERPGKSLR